MSTFRGIQLHCGNRSTCMHADRSSIRSTCALMYLQKKRNGDTWRAERDEHVKAHATTVHVFFQSAALAHSRTS